MTEGLLRRTGIGLGTLAAGLMLHGLLAAQQRHVEGQAARALAQGRCKAALEPLNEGLKQGDPESYFLVGLMYVKGLCVAAAPERGPAYLEPAAKAAQADAARLLVMMHGFGLGVPQSYAQAGRWMIALMDIEAIRKGRSPSFVDDQGKPFERLDSASAEALGVLGSVAVAVQDRVMYPKPGAGLAAGTVELELNLRLDALGIHHSFTNVRSKVEYDIQSTIVRRSPQPHVELLEQVVEEVIKELPPYPPQAKTASLVIPYAFVLK